MRFWKEFKQFAMRGNVIDLAVGVIIGAAFAKITSSLVNDIIMPPLGLFIGNTKFTSLQWILKPAVTDKTGKVITEAVAINYGSFLQTVTDFILIAFAIFLLVKFIMSLKRKEDVKKVEEKQDVLSKQESLLVEIRDILKDKPQIR